MGCGLWAGLWAVSCGLHGRRQLAHVACGVTQGHLHHRVTEEFVKNVITKAANEARVRIAMPARVCEPVTQQACVCVCAQERGLLWQAAFLYLRIGPDRIKPVLSIVNDRVGAVAAEYSGNTNRRNWVALAQTIHSKVRAWCGAASMCVGQRRSTSVFDTCALDARSSSPDTRPWHVAMQSTR